MMSKMKSDKKEDDLEIHYDDSSDELDSEDGLNDSLEEGISSLDIALRNDSQLSGALQTFKYSFVNYSWGLMLLHSASVSLIYRRYKEQLLGMSDVPKDEIIDTWLRNSLIKAIYTDLLDEDHQKASKKIITHCLDILKNEIDETILGCLRYKRQIVKAATHNLPLPEEVNAILARIQDRLLDIISDQSSYVNVQPGDFSPPKRITSENLYNVNEIRDYTEHQHRQTIRHIETVHSWVTGNNFKGIDTVLTPTGLFSSSRKTKDRCDRIISNFNLKEIQKHYILAIKGLNSAENTSVFLNRFKKQLLRNELYFIIQREEAKGNESIIQQGHIMHDSDIDSSEFAPFSDFMEIFMPTTIDKFKESMQSLSEDLDLSDSFLDHLSRTKDHFLTPHVSRAVLPTMFMHTFTTYPEYLATLRLTNRSTLRTKKNLVEDTGHLGESYWNHLDFSWQFPTSRTEVAIEQTQVTKNARSSIIPIQRGADSYDKLLARIQNITNIDYQIEQEDPKKVSEQDFALWVRNCMQCRNIEFSLHKHPNISVNFKPSVQKQLKQFIVQFAHLLGGTEAMRYPGTLIETQMVLDLILYGKLTWEEALNPKNAEGRFLPMTAKEAVKTSRVLAKTYPQYNSYKYRYEYPGDTQSGGIHSKEVKTFVRAEERLSFSWLSMIREKERNADLRMVDALKKSTKDWYPGV